MGGTVGKQWVFLAAGSKGWKDYDDQANVCHAYQMVHNNGIPDEQVVVMMYDDIAYNEENPNKGEIINEPDGPNVYTGVLKDYTGPDVTPNNFLAVLRGDEAAVVKRGGGPKKVLKSDKNDTIFVFLSDHGGPGLFVFPNDYLYACDLFETVTKMAEQHKFSKMVIYILCCHSGSMIENLPENIEVYGLASSEPDQLSYACFYDEERNAFLAGEFSYWWLNHCETAKLTTTTFQDQNKFLNDKMTYSKPHQYGNTKLTRLFISEFLVSPYARFKHWVAWMTSYKPEALPPTDLTPIDDIPLVICKATIDREKDPEKKTALQRDYDKLLEKRRGILKTIDKIACNSCPEQGAKALEKPLLDQLKEMKEVTQHFRETFSEWFEGEDVGFVLSHLCVFSRHGMEVDRIHDAIDQAKSPQCLCSFCVP